MNLLWGNIERIIQVWQVVFALKVFFIVLSFPSFTYMRVYLVFNSFVDGLDFIYFVEDILIFRFFWLINNTWFSIGLNQTQFIFVRNLFRIFVFSKIVIFFYIWRNHI